MCGSIEHPHPAKKDVESVDISEEKLQNMQTNVDKLRKDQEKAAGDAAAARSEYDTRKDTYIASVRKLQERFAQKYFLYNRAVERNGNEQCSGKLETADRDRTGKTDGRCEASGKNP